MKTIQQQRIEIAKDVIKQIKAKKIIAECGTYFELKTKNNAQYKGKQLQEVLPKIRECKACALGGIFYSYVTKHNDFKIDKNGLRYTDFKASLMREEISMFTDAQLELIECAFESNDMYYHCGNRKTYSRKTIGIAENYREKHKLNEENKNDGDLLTHIMKNVIRNKGTFKP